MKLDCRDFSGITEINTSTILFIDLTIKLVIGNKHAG